MANTGRMVSGSSPRLLQLGVDKVIEHFEKFYKGEVDKIFMKVASEKGFYEYVQIAGMAPATQRNEGDTMVIDSIDQDFNARYPIMEYQKGARITRIAMEDNLYENMAERIGKALYESHAVNRDFQAASVLNNCTSNTSLNDNVSLLSTAHPIQAGGTSSNRLSPDLDLSEDAVEQAVILAQAITNPNGILSDLQTTRLIVPPALQFVAARILGSKYRTGSNDNDINAVMSTNSVDSDYIMWRRLTGSTTWFLQTNADNGLVEATRRALEVRSFNDNETDDIVFQSTTRFTMLVGDWRCLVGSVGP